MAAPVELTVLPDTVFVERVATGQLLNFDLAFTTASESEAVLVSVELRVTDRGGRLVLRRTVDAHGLRPGIETIPDRVVPPSGSLLVFNPLHTFPADLDLATVTCSCTLESDEQRTTVVAEVRPVAYEQKTELVLPLRGRVFVAGGHDFLSPHRRIDPSHPLAAQLGLRANSGRYADDLSLVDEGGALFVAEGRNLDDWFGFGATVRAPGAGNVVAAVGEVRDNTFTGEGVEFPAPPGEPAASIFGNHLVLDHENGEYSVLGHLQYGSLEVESGDTVEAGQPVARLGLSGNTDFVHLHYQLQSGPDARLAEGLPAAFAGIGPLEPGMIFEID